MVYYFTSNVVDPPAVLYMGDDKEENELLIKYGWPEDVWFHVDKLSSAHVYLRLQTGQQISDISEDLIEDCCQLVKANSIEGCKLSETDVVYTMWSNLKKTGDMVTGQVGFHKNKDVKKVRVQKQREIINRLNKTKTHATGVDFRQLREQRDMEERTKSRKKNRNNSLMKKKLNERLLNENQKI
uniref:Coiled-coil domain-containing protein 25 n=1 Tax=Meloidogyne incognita TaxID=6306 RepID=A0A914N8W9_MELIC